MLLTHCYVFDNVIDSAGAILISTVSLMALAYERTRVYWPWSALLRLECGTVVLNSIGNRKKNNNVCAFDGVCNGPQVQHMADRRNGLQLAARGRVVVNMVGT